MSEPKSEDVRVVDRRRFDPDGTPRAEEPRATAEEAPAAPSGAQPGTGETGEALQSALDAAYKRVDELARALQAGERDREAFKQRLTRERERLIDVEKGNVAQTLLETVDELDLSLQSSAGDDSPLAKGVRMIRDGIIARLQTLGVERVDLSGQRYDPNVAEAVDMEVTPNAEDDQRVVAELRPAYRLKDRVIRPGRVKVAKYVAPARA